MTNVIPDMSIPALHTPQAPSPHGIEDSPDMGWLATPREEPQSVLPGSLGGCLTS